MKNNGKIKYAYRFFWLLLIPLSLILRWIASLSPSMVEKIYSQGLYKFIMQPLSQFTGLIPISLWELALIFLSLFIPIKLILLIIHAVRNKKLSSFIPFIANLAVIFSIWFILNTLLWSINYERHSFSVLSGLDIRPSSVDELYSLCNHLLVINSNLRDQVTEDENGVMTVPGGFKSIKERAQLGYDSASAKYPFLKGRYGLPKHVMFSKLMSYTNIIGVYSSLTGEANIDTDIPGFDLASTTMHEMAHQHGFAREDEANFIAWVTCMAHPDADFKYSGSIMALIYSMNALYGISPEKYFELASNYSPGFLRDLAYSRSYWEKFEGATQKVADKLNDTYLKLNGEADGVKSYGRMIDLLLAEYRKKPINPLIQP